MGPELKSLLEKNDAVSRINHKAILIAIESLGCIAANRQVISASAEAKEALTEIEKLINEGQRILA